MITTLDQLKQELAAGTCLEHRHTNVELKATWDQEYGKKISANGNKVGEGVCWLVLGVSKDGVLLGKDDKWLKQTEEHVSQHLNQYLDPLQASGRIETACIN